MTKQDFIELGGKEWIKGEMERVYVNAEIFNNLADTRFSDSKNKFFFDCKTNALMRSYKGKKASVEIQY